MTIPTTNPPTTRPPSTRQGRRKPNPNAPAKRRSLEGILNGYEALEALYRYRAMEPRHVAQLLYLGHPHPTLEGVRDQKSAQQAVNRHTLSWLKGQGWVTVLDGERRSKDGLRLFPEELQILTPAGFAILQEHRKALGKPPHPSYVDPAGVIFRRSYAHWKLMMEVGVSAEAALRLRGGRVTTFWDDYEIRQRARRRKDGIHWGGIEPDALIIAELNGVEHAFLPEIDRGFQPVASDADNSIRTKLIKYRDFYLTHRPNDPLLAPLRQPTVHFLSNSLERIQTIRAEVERLGGRQSYWYSTFDWVQPPYSFLGEVWQVTGREGFHDPMSFFRP